MPLAADDPLGLVRRVRARPLFSLALALVGVNVYLARTQPGGLSRASPTFTRTAVFGGIALLITFFARARELWERKRSGKTAHLEAMFGQASLGISHLSLDGRLTRVNRRMADIIGRPLDEAVGLTCSPITIRTRARPRAADRAGVAAARATQSTSATCVPTNRRCGSTFDGTELLDHQGRPEDHRNRRGHRRAARGRGPVAREREPLPLAGGCDHGHRLDRRCVGQFVAPQESWQASTGRDVSTGYAGWGWAAAIHPDDRERVQGLWRDALAHSRPVDPEARIWNAPTTWSRWTTPAWCPGGGTGQAPSRGMGRRMHRCTSAAWRKSSCASEERAPRARHRPARHDDLDARRGRRAGGRSLPWNLLPAGGALRLADVEGRIHVDDRAHVLAGLTHAARHAQLADEFRFARRRLGTLRS